MKELLDGLILTFATECNTVLLDCGSGGQNSIYEVVMTVITIASISTGILAAVGITIVGIQYLTAGGNEEQTKRAKRRMLEIVIGVALYALLAALIAWLVPRN